ncbi:unnamed protein product [Xylocopa violacea]|uniref:Uncharacterized protein n=1 Tax=Xylocopa violacea TaxID=135666 RepID=A0ABP1NHS1_XYLVO
MGCPPCNIGEDSVIVDNDIYESVVLHNKSTNNLKTHFLDDHLVMDNSYSKPTVRNTLKTSPPRSQKYVSEWEHSYSSNFVQSVASSLVGTAKRVKKKKRERSKSKESKRRDSSESRLAAFADFFRSPSGSRKSSLNSPHSAERKNSVTIKINDTDGLESSPENSIGKRSQHKSRISKSPLRVFNKMKAWGSRDALDDKTTTVKVEYSVLDNTISMSQFNRHDSDQSNVPRFLAANSREGIDFESFESEFCNFDSEHSNDSSISKNSLGLFPDNKCKRSPTSFDSVSGASDACFKQHTSQVDEGFDSDSSLKKKSKSNEYLRSCEEDHVDSDIDSVVHAPGYIKDCECKNSQLNYGGRKNLIESLRDIPPYRRSSEELNTISYVSSKIPEKLLKKNDK